MAKDQYLAGKLAIVTGAGKPNGIGAATAYALAEHGANVSSYDGVIAIETDREQWQVVIHYGKSSVAAAETVKKIETLGVKAVWIPHPTKVPVNSIDLTVVCRWLSPWIRNLRHSARTSFKPL
jgi:NAD(P)-dependent dehydrogenase (short-subunit alcohol dehydrogenase family)